VEKRSFWKLLIESLSLAVPLFVVPALCLVLNSASFVWSLLAIAFTVYKLRKAARAAAGSGRAARDGLLQLALATIALQILAFAWIGAVWMLEAAGQLISVSGAVSQIAGWIQAHWFAEIAGWLILFAVVRGLFCLARPVLTWHQRAVSNAAALFRADG
jgi:hypothetical protein